jgi:hypothetical protein
MMRLLVCLCVLASWAKGVELKYAPAPVDNPLKGLVPYVGASGKAQFPHSMEFRYFAWKDLMTGPDQYDWTRLEKTLDEVSGRGNQLVFRVFAEYPKKGVGIPEFLAKDGVKLTRWHSGDPSGGGDVVTPDYRDPRLRSAMQRFIAALGANYDGDPRAGFITAGMLGLWGEWHDYPRVDLWAPNEVQDEVMTAYEKAFKTTKILLRYPAGENSWKKAPNAKRAFGYHDDSFAWATLDTGQKKDDWYFMPAMKAAGAEDKWKRFPIGGEIRPELWKRSFTDSPHPKGQDFAECVRQTHVSWLMDSGLFDKRFPVAPGRKELAVQEVARMGYELHVSAMRIEQGELVVTVENRGVAPFYHDWPVELRYSAPNIRTKPAFPEWKLSSVLPGEPVEWRMRIGVAKDVTVRMRVANPMKGGKALRFANAGCEEEWVVARP